MVYVYSFLIGGLFCVIGQILIDRTKLTPARILVGFVVLGVVLSSFGFFRWLAYIAGAGATVPLTGFGYALASGVEKAVDENALLGVFTGGLTATSGGIAAAIVFGSIAAMVFKSRKK